MISLAPHTTAIFDKAIKSIDYRDNLKLADIPAIGAMKMEVMLRRSNFRDYYDIYSIVKSGIDIRELVSDQRIFPVGESI